MNLSRIISRYKLLLLVVIFIYVLIYILFFNYSNYSKEETDFLIYINSYKIDNNSLIIDGNGKERVKCYYTFSSEDEINAFKDEYNFGDYIVIKGNLKELTNNTIPNNFNYRKYALTRGEFYSISIKSFYKYKSTLRSYIYKRVKELDSNYINTFLFGNNLDNDDYQVIGISSLFTSFSIILIFLRKHKLYLPVLIFLLISTNFNIKIIILLLILLLKKIEVSYKDIVFIITIVKILDRPLLFTSIYFYYSIIIYLTIILYKKPINNTLFIYLINLVLVPINIYTNYRFNIIYYLLTPVYSILFIPLGFLVSLLIFIMPNFKLLLNYYYFLDYLSSLITKLDKLTIIIMKPSIIILLIIYLIIFIYFINRKRIILYVIPILYLSLFLYPRLYNFKDVYFLDVGQGDSILLRLNNLNILIDTGNKNEEKIITFLHSLGISKLDYVFLTHGDIDHVGNMNKLIDDICIKKVFLNSNKINDNELEIINKTNYEHIEELEININSIYIRSKSYNLENENSSSIMNYIKIDDIKILLLGDASIESIKTFIKDIDDVDILKVSHHGSEYNTNKEIINKMNPRISILSVGKNNIYGHPSKEVLNLLKDSKIYRTDEDGSIMFKIKNNKVIVNNYSP